MSQKNVKRTLVSGAAAGAALLLGCLVTNTAANAEPTTPGVATRQFVAVGSDTIQSLYDGIAYGYTDGDGNFVAPAAPNLDSFEAFGPSPIHRVLNGLVGPSFDRPGGSGAGRQALSASCPLNPNDEFDGVDMQHALDGTTPLQSVDIARSSGQPSSTNLVPAGSSGDDLTSIQIARDAVTIAVGTGLKGVITNVTTSQLLDLYTGTTNTTDGVVFPATGDPTLNGTTVHVELPQSNSGTRQFFLTALFGTQTPSNLWPGVDTTSKLPGATGDPNTLEENNAGEIVTDGLIPFSAAQYIAQFNGVASDTTVAPLGLPTVDGRTAVDIDNSTGVASADTSSNSLYGDTTKPIAAQSTTPSNPAILSRDVYSVVCTSELGTNDLTTLVEDTIPGDTQAIEDYGFLPLDFPDPSGAYLHSSWEN